MVHKMRCILSGFLLVGLVGFASSLLGQSIYDLRKLTQEDWLSMSTDEHLNALSTSYKHAPNQTFLGNFGRDYDLYKKWGYEFYEMEDRYENYSFRGYENYNIIEERRKRWSYNDFGDRIPRMRANFTLWNETYYDDGSMTVYKPGAQSEFINSITTNAVDGVWVAKEATNDWSVSAIYAGAIRTKYTPLTLSIPNLDGMRVDFQSANNSVSIVNSVLIGNAGEMYSKGGAMLRAGHFRRKMGALTLGATYANEYGIQGNRDGGNDWYGTLSNYTPTPMVLAVRVLDDSPEDGDGGPRVNDVRLKVNGRYRDDIVPKVILDDVSRERTSALLREAEAAYLDPQSGIQNNKPAYDFLRLEAQVPKYADYILYNDMVRGMNAANVKNKLNMDVAAKYYQFVEPGMPVQVNGTQYVVYWFDISNIRDVVKRVEAELMVANDYRIQSTMVYTTSLAGGNDPDGNPYNWYRATYWRTEAQAEGNVKDGSNTKKITVEFGIQVANLMYGMDIDFNYRGFKINGEFVTNSQHYMYPDDYPGTGFPEGSQSGQAPRSGHRWTVRDTAYYLTSQKEWKQFGFNGEVFKIGKFYRPYLDYYYTTAGLNSRNYTLRLPMIEDNDDNDQYPDTMYRERSMGYNILGSDDPDGVFPGNDDDNDGIADNNKNNNDLPDYVEPFLMFDVDPDEFVFGNDYNNNNIPDFREDDMKYDTPYDLDRQGHHVSLRFSPIQSVNLFIGSLESKGVGTNNRTNDTYFKVQMDYNVFGIGKLYGEYRHERIQDNIRDTYVQVSTKMREGYMLPGITATIGRFTRDLYFDELEYRNSSVDRLWIDSTIRALPALTLENHLKFERNRQLEGVMVDNVYQPQQDIGTVAMVNKIVYTRQVGNWQFSPGVKFRFYKKDRSEAIRAGDFYLTRVPMLTFKYLISSRTDVMLGMQGLPGLEFTYKDYIQGLNDYEQKTYTLQLQNRSSYFGYQIWAATGVRFDEKKFSENLRNFENYKSSTTFVKIFLGY